MDRCSSLKRIWKITHHYLIIGKGYAWAGQIRAISKCTSTVAYLILSANVTRGPTLPIGSKKTNNLNCHAFIFLLFEILVAWMLESAFGHPNTHKPWIRWITKNLIAVGEYHLSSLSDNCVIRWNSSDWTQIGRRPDADRLNELRYLKLSPKSGHWICLCWTQDASVISHTHSCDASLIANIHIWSHTADRLCPFGYYEVHNSCRRIKYEHWWKY